MNIFSFIQNEKKQVLFTVFTELLIIGLLGILLLWISNTFIIPNPSNQIFRIIESVMSILILTIFFAIKKPSLQDLGLSFQDIRPKVRNIYIIGVSIIFLMIVTSFMFMDILSSTMNLRFGLVSPIFEEILFRGYLWYRLTKSKVEDISMIFITGVLFGLFHLFGYYEYSYETGFSTEAPIMLNVVVQKVLLNISFGLLLGYVRYKLKKLYPSFLIHSFANIILGH
jgi:membrane protease YdiL (CAAX protease family)